VRRRGDHRTYDLFEAPPSRPSHEGALVGLKTQIAHLMSSSIRQCGLDRYKIAAGMSALLGEDVSKLMLDAYTAESRDDQNIPAHRLFAFIVVTESFDAFDHVLKQIGCRLLVGEDVRLAALAKLEANKKSLERRIKSLKQQIRGDRG
jgi:hypothetical protein